MIQIDALKKAVEGLHECKVTFKEIAHIEKTFEGDVVWDGNVYSFDIEGHPIAKICYAWSSPIPQSDQQRFYAVLNQDPVNSAQDAVRASIARDDGELE